MYLYLLGLIPGLCRLILLTFADALMTLILPPYAPCICELIRGFERAYRPRF